MLALSAAVAAGVTACNVQPGAAGFVGGQRYTQSQVDSILDSVQTDFKGTLKPQDRVGIRQATTANLIMRAVARKVAADKHLKVPPPNYAEQAKRYQLPESNPYIRLEAETLAYVNAVRDAATSRKPTEADARQVYESLLSRGVPSQQLPFAELKKNLDNPDIDKVFTARDELAAGVRKYHVDVNPRYGKVTYQMDAVSFQVGMGQSVIGSVGVPLGGGSPDVVRTPAPNPLQG